MEYSTKNQSEAESFGCTNCGADLKYQPGTRQLICEKCGAKNEIPEMNTAVDELDFLTFLEEKQEKEVTHTERFVKCDTCGASPSIAPNITSLLCPYCATPLILDRSKEETIIQPKSLLPFQLSKNQAKEAFGKWMNKLWFAPNDLKKSAVNADHFQGLYLPYWTYDSDTHTEYIGQRGEYYYVTETYTTNENGKSVTKTRQVQKTRWYPASGQVDHFFDDLLVPATTSLPAPYLNALEPWDLKHLLPYEKSFLSGFISEKYQIDLKEGFEIAKKRMTPQIRDLIKEDIGGDDQRIVSLRTQHRDITFKHLLLPVYVSAYRYNNKLYRFLVNGCTGEVQGERAYSWIKITLTALAAIAGIAILYFLANHYH